MGWVLFQDLEEFSGAFDFLWGEISERIVLLRFRVEWCAHDFPHGLEDSIDHPENAGNEQDYQDGSRKPHDEAKGGSEHYVPVALLDLGSSPNLRCPKTSRTLPVAVPIMQLADRFPATAPAQYDPTQVLVCEVHEDIPELRLEKGDRIVIRELGDPDGIIRLRAIDTATALAAISHASVSVVPLPRRQVFDPPAPRPGHPGPQLVP